MQPCRLPADNSCMTAHEQGHERGASAVEVALLIAVVAIVVAGAVRLVGRGSEQSLATVGSSIHGSGSAGPATSGGGGGGSGGGGGGGGPGPIVPPTTAAPPTPTTTAPPTTAPATTTPPTTAPPTTTTTAPPPAVATGSLGSASSRSTGAGWIASAELTLLDQRGEPVVGAEVTVEVRSRRVRRSGSVTWDTTTRTGTVGADGRLVIETGPWRPSGSNRITDVTYEVIDVEVPDGGSWDEGPATIAIAAP